MNRLRGIIKGIQTSGHLSLVDADVGGDILSAIIIETPETADYLKYALRACEGGVARAHIIPYNLDGSMLLELFQHDGVGTMVVEETLEALREATPDDVGGLIALIRPLEEDGTLVRRDRPARRGREFHRDEHDGVIRLRCPVPPSEECRDGLPGREPGGAEQRRRERLEAHEQRARAAGLRRLFVLTTRTMHWFLKRGFVPADVDQLPGERRNLYNWQRKSQVLIKNL
jgi:amino-acid N-acetyltransferase